MPGKKEMMDAAKVAPSKRTVAQQALVDKGSAQQAVRNLDHEAKRQEKWNW